MRDRLRHITCNLYFQIAVLLTLGLLPLLWRQGGLYLSGDISRQILPFIYETKRMLSSGMPLWSWNTYLGDNFVGAYAYYTLYNPFAWFNCLFPYRLIPLGFTLTLYIKFMICGYTTQLYLRRLGFGHRLVLVGTLLYVFSSFAITNLIYYMFVEPMMVFPLLLYAIERYVSGDRYRYTWLTLAVALVIVANYYFAIASILAASIYLVCRVCASSQTASCKLRQILGAVLCAFMGTLLTTFLWLPVVYQVMDSPRQAIDMGGGKLCAIAARVFGLLYPKTYEGGDGYIYLESGFKSNASALSIFGFLPFILLMFKTRCYMWLKAYILVMLVLFFTPLNGVFTFFNSCYYTRWTYALILGLIVASLCYFKDYGLPSRLSAWIYALFFVVPYAVFAYLSLRWQYSKSPVHHNLIYGIYAQAAVIAANFAALIYICHYRGKPDGWIGRFLLSVLICVPLQMICYTSTLTYGSLSYNDCSHNEAEYFKHHNGFLTDSAFHYRYDFRVDSQDLYTPNFAIICNRPSVSAYHSTPNGRLAPLFDMECEFTRHFFTPVNHPESFAALMSVRKLVNFSADPTVRQPIFGHGRYEFSDGMLHQYEYDYYIPMGFCYDRYQSADGVRERIEGEKGTMHTLDIPLSMLDAVAIEPEDEEALSPYLTKTEFNDKVSLDSIVACRRQMTCDYFEGDTHGFDAHITLDRPRLVFFSVVSDPGFTATIDGTTTRIYQANLGLSAVVVPAGSHDIRFEYFPRGLKAGIAISLVAILFVIALANSERRRQHGQ